MGGKLAALCLFTERRLSSASTLGWEMGARFLLFGASLNPSVVENRDRDTVVMFPIVARIGLDLGIRVLRDDVSAQSIPCEGKCVYALWVVDTELANPNDSPPLSHLPICDSHP